MEELRERGYGRGAGSKWVWVWVGVCGGQFGVCALGGMTMGYGLGAVRVTGVCACSLMHTEVGAVGMWACGVCSYVGEGIQVYEKVSHLFGFKRTESYN